MNEDISNINVGGLNVNYIDGKVSYGLSIKNVGTEYNSDFSEDAEIKEKNEQYREKIYGCRLCIPDACYCDLSYICRHPVF